MRIYLASLEQKLNNAGIIDQIRSFPRTISILGSYYIISRRNKKGYSKIIPYLKDFMLDSGAFSFINSQKAKISWDEYLEEYASYIGETHTEKYFELDIDLLVGYEKVKEYRARLEALTGVPSIPVWHRSRGREEFMRLCDEYPYVAVGGIAIKHIRLDEYKYFTMLIQEAHKRNCKIHALGFTHLTEVRKYHFDSVDSSSWTSGGRYGSVYRYSNGKMHLQKHRANTRVTDVHGIDSFNFREWVKYQRYAEVHL
jgi:hypothetical protein